MNERGRRVEREDVDPADALGAAGLPLPEGQPRGFVPEEAPRPAREPAPDPEADADERPPEP